MSFLVAEESQGAAQAHAIALLGATRKTPVDAARFDWLYRKNPDGEAVLWTVRDGKSGEMAGFTVALPRRVMVDGEVRICWNGADFSMHPKFRTLGPAIKLRRAAREGVDAGRVDFLYAHPNERMAVVHARVGHLPVGRMFRYAKPLRIGPYLQTKVSSRFLAGILGAVGDRLVRLGARETWHRSTCEVGPRAGDRFDERYDRLFEQAAGCARVVGVRDARYLNWRYAENPLYETRVLEARDGGRLRAYLLYVVNDDTASIKDVFPPGDGAAVRDLIAGVIREGRRLGLRSASVTTLEGNPLDRHFAEFGFRLRPESSQMFAYAPPERPWREVVTDRQAWFLTVGDRDV